MSHVLYCRIPEDIWRALVEESKQSDTPLVRTVIMVLRRGLLQDQLKG